MGQVIRFAGSLFLALLSIPFKRLLRLHNHACLFITVHASISVRRTTSKMKQVSDGNMRVGR